MARRKLKKGEYEITLIVTNDAVTTIRVIGKDQQAIKSAKVVVQAMLNSIRESKKIIASTSLEMI